MNAHITRRSLASLALGLLLLGPVSAGEPVYPVDAGKQVIIHEPLDCGPWTFSANWVHLHISERDSIDLFGPIPPGIVNADDFDQGYDSGLEVAVERRLNERLSLEASFLHSSWEDSFAHGGDTGVFFNPAFSFFPSFPSPATGESTSLESELNDFQLNLKRRVNERLVVDLGFRYIQFDDNFRPTFGDTVTVPNFIQWDTENTLLGGQIAVHAVIFDKERLRITGDASFGLFANETDNNFRAFDTFLPQDAFGSDSQSSVATVFELELGAEYDLTDCLTLYGGYRVFWMNQLALAPEQVAQTADFTGINGPIALGTDNDSDLFFHGLVLGTKITF